MDLLGKVKDLAGPGQDGMDRLLEPIKAQLAELAACLPALKEAGYDVDDVSVDLSGTPKICATLKCSGAPDEAKLRAMAGREGKGLAGVLTGVIIQASKLQDGVSIGSLKMKQVEVELGLGTPRLMVKFSS